MLEKNKDYVEFTLQCTSVEGTRDKDYREVHFNGYSDSDFPCVPMDVVCKEFGHKVVMISKSDFERLQAENEELKKKLQVPDPFAEYKELLEKLHSKEDVEKFEWTLNHICGGQASVNGWMVTAKLWRRNYETLSKLVGFSSVEEIEDYLVNEAECDTLHETISKLHDQVKYTCDEWYSANSRNNSWKAAAECNTPKELMEKLNLLRDDISGRSTVIEHYKRDIEKWQNFTGYSNPEDYIRAKNSWEAKTYANALQEWKEVTGYPSPSAAKTAIEAGASWCHAYNDVKKANEELADSIKAWQKATGCPSPLEAKNLIEETKNANQKLDDDTTSWRNVTGYSTPEDFVAARIKAAMPFDHTAAWQKATGCTTPERAKERIKALNERIDESEADYNHLLCTTGFESEGEIEDALDKCDHSTLRKALVDYEFDYESLLKLTGYKSEDDICMTLNHSEQFVYETLMELVNSLKRKAKFTDSNWETVTGFSTPEKCSSYIDRLEKKLEDIKNLTEED